jgi:molybdenum cofactor guanylyltransferase
MTIPCSGIILSGGLNTRHEGRNKAFCPVGGSRIIDRVFGVMSALFDDLIVVTNDPPSYLDLNATIVTDIYPERSSLTGIHAGLSAAVHEHAFCMACDTPFVRKELIELLLATLRPSDDVLIPQTRDGLEPLCAIYSRRCLNAIERNLSRNIFKIQNFFTDMSVRKIPDETLRTVDPDLVTFYNVNSPDRLRVAEEMDARM